MDMDHLIVNASWLGGKLSINDIQMAEQEGE